MNKITYLDLGLAFDFRTNLLLVWLLSWLASKEMTAASSVARTEKCLLSDSWGWKDETASLDLKVIRLVFYTKFAL